jgi:hypothetical protein
MKVGDLVHIKTLQTKLNFKSKFENMFCYEFDKHNNILINELISFSCDFSKFIFCPICLNKKNIFLSEKFCTIIYIKNLKIKDKINENVLKIYNNLDTYMIKWCCILYDHSSFLWTPYINVSKL